MSTRFWKTRGGVLVFEASRTHEADGVKIRAFRVVARGELGGFHGWLWLKNLTAAKAPKRRARK